MQLHILGSDKAGLGKAGAGAGTPVRHFMQLLIIFRAHIQTHSAHSGHLYPSTDRSNFNPQTSRVHEATQLIPRRRHPTTLLTLPFPPPSPGLPLVMATNGAQQVYEPVLAAHNVMQSGSNRAQKEQAHQFLEKFQKSVCWAQAWTWTWADRADGLGRSKRRGQQRWLCLSQARWMLQRSFSLLPP